MYERLLIWLPGEVENPVFKVVREMCMVQIYTFLASPALQENLCSN